MAYRVQPSTPWEVVLYVDNNADERQQVAVADILLGRAGGTVARQYGRAIGDVHVTRRARIVLEHIAPRKRIGAVGVMGRRNAAFTSDFDDRSDAKPRSAGRA